MHQIKVHSKTGKLNNTGIWSAPRYTIETRSILCFVQYVYLSKQSTASYIQYRSWPQAGEAWASGRHIIKYFSSHKITKCDFSLVVLRLLALVRGHGFNFPATHTYNFGLYFILASRLQICRTGTAYFKTIKKKFILYLTLTFLNNYNSVPLTKI